jgi:site-specific recombinase XerD
LSDLDQFIRTMGEMKPAEVRSRDIDRFVDEQQMRGLKPTTINRRVASLHTFFEVIASDDGYESFPNPINWRRHRVQVGQSLPRDASDADVEALFGAVSDQRDRAMFGLMVGAGLRVGEVIALQCHNLQAPDSAGKSARLLVRGKGHKERVVWLTPRWYQEVQAWVIIRPESDCDRLFLNQHHRPLSEAGVQYRLKQGCEAAGVQFSCHQLRHTFARRLAEQRMPTESIAKLLGHESVTTTQRYTAGANPDLRDAFLSAMQTADAAEPSQPVVIAPQTGKRQAETVDMTILTQSLARLATLPLWMQPIVTAFFKRRWGGMQPHTAKESATALTNHLVALWRWFIDERQLTSWSSLTRADVQAWIAARQAADINASTIRAGLSLFKACVREAVAQEITVSADVLRVNAPEQPKPLPRYLSEDEMRRLEQTVVESTMDGSLTDKLQRAWFLTLSLTGLRCAELLNLRVSDIDFATQRLIVYAGKMRQDRIVYLSPLLTTALVAYLAVRPATTDDHLWIKPSGSRLARHNIKYRLHQWGAASNVAVTPHRLRHTFATRLVNAGLPLPSVAKLLGHRSLDMTQHYARLYEQTVHNQFDEAMAHIEGIVALDWPRSSQIPASLSEHICDSV